MDQSKKIKVKFFCFRFRKVSGDDLLFENFEKKINLFSENKEIIETQTKISETGVVVTIFWEDV